MAHLVLIRFLTDRQDDTCITCADTKHDIFQIVYALSQSPFVLQISVMGALGDARMPKDYGFGSINKWVKEVTFGVQEDDDES